MRNKFSSFIFSEEIDLDDAIIKKKLVIQDPNSKKPSW